MFRDTVGFTGPRGGMTGPQRFGCAELLEKFGIQEVHLGDCVGADDDMYEIAGAAECYLTGHPPDNDKFRAFRHYHAEREPKPYLDRNHDIVDESDWMIATPEQFEEQQRSGTWSTVRYARKTGKPLCLVWPDGTKTFERMQAT